MAIAVQLPALSPTMKEGKITRWLKKEGDKVSSGTAVAECETDKSNLEIEVYDDGVILKILVPEGGMAPVGSTIAWIGKAGEAIPSGEPAKPVAAAPAPVAAPKAAVPVAAAPVVAPPAPVAAVAEQRLRASPLAKKIASETGLDLSRVAGSGPSGRVVKKDVEDALSQKPARAAAPVTRGVRLAPDSLPVTSMRKVIAQRLTEVKPGVPHFYLNVEIEMDQALALREEAKSQELKVSVNDIIVKATAMAVRRFPRINQVFAGDTIQQLKNVDVGVAVAIEDGLITPIIKDADQKGLAEIAGEVRDLAERAKKKSLKPDEYTGGSITVSNLGMFGIDSFIAVINPPQAAILAVGKVESKVVVRNEQMVIRKMMSMTLSGDHRVIDGAVGAQFLQELKALLEHPAAVGVVSLRRVLVTAMVACACKTAQTPDPSSKPVAAADMPVPIEALYAFCWPDDAPADARVKVGFQGADVYFEATNGASNSTGRCVREIAAAYPHATRPSGTIELAPVTAKPTGWAALAWVRLLSSSRYSDERGLVDPLPMAAACAKLGGLRRDATYEIKHVPEYSALQVGGAVSSAETCLEATLGSTAWPSTRELTLTFGDAPAVQADPRARIYEPQLGESLGAMDPQTVHDAIATRREAVAQCWESALLRRSNLTGPRTLRFRADAKGAVRAWVAHGLDEARQVSDFKLDACLVDVVEHTHFATPGEGLYTWVFAQR